MEHGIWITELPVLDSLVELLRLFILFALLFIPKAKEKKPKPYQPSESDIGEANEVIEQYRDGDDKFKVSAARLAKAQNSNLQDYIANAIPKDKVVKNSSTGDEAGDNSPIVAYRSNSDRVTALENSVLGGELNSGKDDKSLLEKISKLYTYKLIDEDELVKSIAAVAHNGGKGSVSIPGKDKFESPSFKSDDERLATEIANKFFEENSLTKTQVEALYTRHCDKIPLPRWRFPWSK